MICAHCGREFTPVSGHVRYCSARCVADAKNARIRARRRNREPRRCELCGAEFVPYDMRMRYCSAECRRRASELACAARLGDRVCAQCGATFTPTRVRARFCSLECKHAWWAANRPDRKRSEPLEPRKCAHCGREFTPRDGRQRFCSPRCQHLAWELARGVRVTPLERKCVVCGKAFVATRPDRKYCSPNCAAAAYRDRNRTKFEPRACLYCGTVFTPTHHKGAQFCSSSCRRSYRYRHGVNPGTISPRRTGGVDRAKVEAYLRLPDDERYARRAELTQAERLLAMRIWNEWHLREEW